MTIADFLFLIHGGVTEDTNLISRINVVFLGGEELG